MDGRDIGTVVYPDAELKIFLTASRDVLVARKLSYELNGSVGIDTSVVGVVRIPFSKTGRFDPEEFIRQRGFGFN